jgi:hypothetical protein
MSDETTDNYDFVLPNNNSLMKDPVKYLNDNWTKIENIPAPNIITDNLPTAGDYKLYDRIYYTNDSSIYILVVNDPNWGFVWRPVHSYISPWQSLPFTIYFDGSLWQNTASPNSPQIAMDNRGRIYWRGAVTYIPGAIPRNTSFRLFKDMPAGIAPSRSNTFMLGLNSLSLSGSGLGMWQGARLYMEAPDTNGLGSNPRYTTVRVFGGSVDPATNIYLNMSYYPGEKAYYGT